jgi:putative ABC transport system permease protein
VSLATDLRQAFRRLRAARGFTVAVLVTLALGIGANVAVFSIVNAMLLRPLPYAHADRLVMLWQDHRARGVENPEWQTPPDYLDLREDARAFDGVVAYRNWGATLSGRGEPRRVLGAAVSHDWFGVLGVPLARGRAFTAAEDRSGAERVVVVTDAFWRGELGGDPQVLGRALVLNGDPWTIVGVLPPSWRDPIGGGAIYRPLRLDPASQCARGCYSMRAVGRMRPGVTLARAEEDADRVMRRAAERFPASNAGIGARVTTLREQLSGEVRPALLALAGAVAFVLLIGCVNVANLLLARAASRGPEIAVRAALGAGRERIVRQLLTESAVLALLGGALGVAVGWYAVRLVLPLVPEGTREFYAIGVDGRAVAFALALSALASLVFGLGPALSTARRGLADTLRAAGRGVDTGRRTRRTGSALVLGEVALAIVLLTGAGLLMRSFVARQTVDTGYVTSGVLFAGLTLPPERYPAGGPALGDVVQRLVDDVARDRRVRVVAAASETPLQGGDGDAGFTIEGRPEPRPVDMPSAWVRAVTPDYLRAMGMRVVAGRGLTAEDRRAAPRVALVSEALARRHWPGERAVGRRIRTSVFTGGDSAVTITIVGVVGDVRFDAPDAPPKAELYLPHAQAPASNVQLVVRTDAAPEAIVPTLRAALAAQDRAVPLGAVDTIAARLRDAVALPRLYATLFGAFAAAAVLLAAVGIYGVVAYGVSVRTRELGLRMALGARAGDVRRLVLRQGLAPVAAGAVVGLGGALAAARALRGLLFGVGVADPLTLGAVTALLAAVALAAIWVPARRATAVPPMTALRGE